MRFLFLLVLGLSFTLRAPAANWPATEDPRLIPVYHAGHVWNAVTTTTDGRVFVGFPGPNNPGVQLAEMTGPGTYRAFPDAAWNAWKPGQSPNGKFVHVNAIRIGPDGKLWVIDSGATGIGNAKAVPGGARAVAIDLSTNRVSRIYDLAHAPFFPGHPHGSLEPAIKPASYIDDMRFNGRHAYFTDAGAPGLLVLDLATGEVHRVLDNDPTCIDTRPLHADGKILRDKKGRELRVQTDQLEVSPDGKWLDYQPCSGPFARIETKYLDNAALAPAEVAKHAQVWVDTPTTGGTAIADDGSIFYGVANNRSIIRIAPDGAKSLLVQDPRLVWSDAMWLDRGGFLWIPATQQNLTPGFNDGKDDVKYPVWIFKMQVHARPPERDHS